MQSGRSGVGAQHCACVRADSEGPGLSLTADAPATRRVTQERNQVRVKHETSGKQEYTDLIRIHHDARHIVRFEIQLRHVLGAGSIWCGRTCGHEE